MKTALMLGLALALTAATAEAAPRYGYGAPRPPEAPRAPSMSDPGSFKPWKPYKGYSIYGDDPTSVAPSRTPGRQPGLTPRNVKPFPSEGVFGPSGGTFQDRRRGTF